MSDMILSEATPFTTYEIAQRDYSSTGFTIQSPWAHQGGTFLGFILSQVITESTWVTSISNAMLSQHSTSGRAGSEVGSASREYYDDSPVWHVSLDTSEPEQTISPAVDVGEDRRIYALAAVERLQRLLGLTQTEVVALIGVSRPTLWNWEQGRVPQERSVRRLYDIAGTIDLLVEWSGDEARFDVRSVARDLDLGEDIPELLKRSDGSRLIRDRLFNRGEDRTPAPTLIPTPEELEAAAEVDALGATASQAPPRPRTRRLRPVSRRSRREEGRDDPERDSRER